MKVRRTVKKVIEADIDSCFYNCPYFTVEGQDSEMLCGHPHAPKKDIISHPDCMNGFPKDCPLTGKP